MNILTALEDFFKMNNKRINHLAMVSTFRKKIESMKQLHAKTFLLVFVICLHEINHITLDILASKCEEIQKGLSLTKQALFQRLPAGGKLLKEIYLELLSNQTMNNIRYNPITALEQFSDVKFVDGSTISLPDKLKHLYKGMGGKNAAAAMKIQATYSLFLRKYTAFDVFPATKHDATYNEIILENMQAKELYINDLGYFDMKNLVEIRKKNAYYISRIKKNTVLYELVNGEYKEILFEEMLSTAGLNLDREVYIKITKKQFESLRLVGQRLPENKVNERKRKANKKAQKKGKTLSKKEKLTLEWFLAITNISKDMLEACTCCETYRIRWQIELSFKALKSGLGFDVYSYCGESYFNCLFYGKLIFVLLTIDLFSRARLECHLKTSRLISLQRFLKNLRCRLQPLLDAFLNPNISTVQNLIEMLVRVSKRSFFEIRKRKTTEYELMEHDIPLNYELLSSYSNY